MKYKFVLPEMFVLLAVLLLLSGVADMDPAGADPLASRGAALAYACAACHGPDGRSQGAIPSLDTLLPEHFGDALQAFRTEARQGTVMNPIAKGLDNADIEAVTAYFATLKQH